MNLENMQTWVDALRNDTDGQCIGELVDMRGCHCVIGVGIVASGKPISRIVSMYDQIFEFCEWLDAPSTVALFVTVDGGKRRGVMELNDTLHISLADIADLLEAEHLTPAAP